MPEAVSEGRSPQGLRLGGARQDDLLAGIVDELLVEDMERFRETLLKALEPQRQYLTETEREIYRRGKKVRPAMLMLSARMVHGDSPLHDKVIMAAASLEMLHVATLIHDDIIDDALVRRGLTSINAERGSEAAILLGDMQFVSAIRTFVDAIEVQSEMELVKLVLDTAFRICAGELDELETDPNLDTAALRERYFEVIERKTAIMFGLACETGVSLVRGRTSQARRIGFYGRRVGRAFQIVDDLFDFLQQEAGSGKRRGMDLARRCLSLPIVYAMETLGAEHLVSRIIRGRDYTEQELERGVEAVIGTDAPARAYADARHQAIDALEYLKPFPDNRYRDALRAIALNTVDRSF